MVYNCSFPFSKIISLEVFLVLCILVLALFLYSFISLQYFKLFPMLSFLGVGFLFVGGSYNLSVRYFQGCVPDPYDFFGIFSFNSADVLVNIGFALLVLVYIMDFVSAGRIASSESRREQVGDTPQKID